MKTISFSNFLPTLLMLPLQVPSLPAPIRRSPSPVIPGAWPSDSPSNASGKTSTSELPAQLDDPLMSDSQNLLHLDHVLDFQQKLSLSLSKPAHSSNDSRSVPFSPRNNGFATAGSIPSDDSDLTRFTRVGFTFTPTYFDLNCFTLQNDTSTSLSGLGVSLAFSCPYDLYLKDFCT